MSLVASGRKVDRDHRTCTMPGTLSMIAVAAALFGSQLAVAADRSDIAILGIGNSPCSSWTDGRQHQSGETPNVHVMAQLSWVQGFITALDADTVREGGPSIGGIATVSALTSGLDGYCKPHPKDNIATAAVKVATELLKQVMGR